MKHIAYINKKPEISGRNSTPDGAITGNGDLAVILGNAPDGLRIFLSKVDLWYGTENTKSGGIRPLGYIDIPVRADMYENYYAEMDMDEGLIRLRFQSVRDIVSLTIRVAADENAVLIEKTGNIDISPVLRVFDTEQTEGRKGDFSFEGVNGVFRSFDSPDCVFETHVFAALKAIDNKHYYAFVATNHDTPDPQKAVASKINAIRIQDFEKLCEKHSVYWLDFWKKSSFTLSDEKLELGWYASQYYLAVCARNREFPPGLYGNFITVEHPNWHSDYHLNYNYQAPFYAACSSNHPELTDCYMAPLEAFAPRGREYASHWGCRGIVYPCGLGPKGIMTEKVTEGRYQFERPFMGQKSDAVHAADIAVFRWNTTKDIDFARDHAYPYIRECLDFFTDYAVYENGRFSIPDDAAHEVPYYSDAFREKRCRYVHDTNNSLTLGMLRLCIPAAIEMATALGTDSDKVEKWRDFLDKLSPFPTCYRFGKKVFRYTEHGMRWHGDNDVGQQFIFPGGCIGLSSSEKELKIARNTVSQRLYDFTDCNAVSSFYAIAARVGWNAGYMIDKLREFDRKTLLPNLLHDEGGGGIEYCTVAATALNEMAMQSHQGIVRIFPDWDNRLDCEYKNLRADGAFLVSSSITNGIIGQTEILSEKGGKLSLIMGAPVSSVIINGEMTSFTAAELESGIATKPGDTVIINPA